MNNFENPGSDITSGHEPIIESAFQDPNPNATRAGHDTDPGGTYIDPVTGFEHPNDEGAFAKDGENIVPETTNITQSFYKPEINNAGVEVNRIADPSVAKDLAQVQENQGMRAMQSREQKLMVENSSTELTELEGKNAALIEGLTSEDKYPHAFQEYIMSNGEKCLIFAPEDPLDRMPWEDNITQEQLNEYKKITASMKQYGVKILTPFGLITPKRRSLTEETFLVSDNHKALMEGADFEAMAYAAREAVDVIPGTKELSTVITNRNGRETNLKLTVHTDLVDTLRTQAPLYRAVFQTLERNNRIREVQRQNREKAIANTLSLL